MASSNVSHGTNSETLIARKEDMNCGSIHFARPASDEAKESSTRKGM
jgi:hypothetical protein